LEVLNTNRDARKLRVEDPSRLVAGMSKDIPEHQQLREFFHNAVHAVARVGGGDVIIDWVERDGVRKLAIIDTGCGMSPSELQDLIGQLASSAEVIEDARFGVGAKLTGLAHNKLGIEYTTITEGTAVAVRATLGTDVDGGFSWLDDEHGVGFHVTDDLPRQIVKAGHGTMVVLLGNTSDEDTFARACGLSKGNKAITLYFNDRYAHLPRNIKVRTKSARNKKEGSWELRENDLHGLLPALKDVCLPGDSGTVHLDGATVRWFYSVGKTNQVTRYRQGDNVHLRNLVAVGLLDAEVPDLQEIYDLQLGRHASSTLASFGLAQVAGSVALYVEPDGVRSLHNRTGLVNASDGEAFTLDALAAQFRDRIPARLAQLIDEAIAGRQLGDDERLQNALKAYSGLLDVSSLSSTGTASLNAPGAAGAFNPKRHSRKHKESTGDGSPKSPTSGGGAGSGPGGSAASAKSASSSPQTGKAKGVLLPSVVFLTDDELDADDALRHQVGYYHEASNSLFVNTRWGGIDVEHQAYLKKLGRARLSKADLAATRQDVLDKVIDRLREPIVRMLGLAKVDDYWKVEANRQHAFSAQALTMTAMTMLSGSAETSRVVSNTLGR
jgi:hypothetical protein